MFIQNVVGCVLLGALITIILACNKEHFDTPIGSEQTISYRSSELQAEFQNWYGDQIDNWNGPDSLPIINPYMFEIDWSSGTFYEALGENTMVFNVKDVPFEDVPNVTIQIAFEREVNDIYSINSLVYFAYDSFYNIEQFEPRILNFTGFVLRYDVSNQVRVAYSLGLGDVLDEHSGSEIDALVIPPPPPDPSCPDAGGSRGSGAGTANQGWFADMFSKLWGNGGLAIFGPTSSSGWNAPAWSSGGWGNHNNPHNPNNNGSYPGPGSGSGGGTGSGSNTPLCEQSTFWTNYDVEVKRAFIRALSAAVDYYDLASCNDPFMTGAALNTCYTDQEMRCLAFQEGCFQGDNLDENSFKDCLSKIFGSISPENNNPTYLDLCLQNNLFLNFISSSLRTTIMDPCNPEIDGDEIIDDALMAACDANKDDQLDGFYSALPGLVMSQLTAFELTGVGIDLEMCCTANSSEECFEEEILTVLEANNGFIMDPDDEGLNNCERLLAARNPVWALRAIKGKQARDEAIEHMISVWGNAGGYGDCRDAYRHALWMALFAQKTNQEVAIEFGIAHECSTPAADAHNHKPMDLHNNWIGASIGNAFPSADINSISILICEALENGSLKRLDPSDANLIVFTNVTGCSCP